jgi:raffinose/stachyose/melibiose transport system substrate-binding protein
MRKTYRLFTLIAILAVVAVLAPTKITKAQAVKIRMWSIATPADAMGKVQAAAVENFNKTHTDVQFEVSFITNDDFKTQVSIAASAGQQPDVFQTWGGGQLQDFIKAGVVRDIPELSGDAGAKFSAASLSPATFDGKHYAVPVDMAAVFLWTNVDLLKENSLPMPDTWENFIAICKGLRAKNIIPVQLGNQQKWPGAFWMIYLVDRIGGPDIFNNAFNRVKGGTFEDPVFIQAGKLLQEAVDAQCFEDGYNGTPYDQTLIGTGKAAMQLQGTWNLGGLRTANKELTDKSIRPLVFPAVKDGKGDPSHLVGGTGQAFAISAKAPKEAAAAVIELLSNEEYFGKGLADAGLLPSLKGTEKYITDPIQIAEAKALSSAKYLQLYYDQFLPPELAALANQTIQDVLGKASTPEQAAKQMEELAQKLLDKK